MTWTDVQKSLVKIDDNYTRLYDIKGFINGIRKLNIKNEILRDRIKKVTRLVVPEINTLPNSINDVRLIAQMKSNDVDETASYLKSIETKFEKIFLLVFILERLININSINFHTSNFKNTLYYRTRMEFYNRLYDVYDDNNMGIKEKYDYANNYYNSLNNDDKRETVIEQIIYYDKESVIEKENTRIMLDRLVTLDKETSARRVLSYRECINSLKEYESYMMNGYDISQIFNLYLPFFADSDQEKIKSLILK